MLLLLFIRCVRAASIEIKETISNMDINDLEQILGILKRNDIVDFELRQGETHIKLTRAGAVQLAQASGGPVVAQIEPAIVSSNINGTAAPLAEPAEGQINSKFVKVESPIVGTFYRKPSPDSEPFVKVGDTVKKGDTLCIVEAMKLMNEIDSPIGGRVEKILLSDGEVVEYGEILFLINPD
ncbi:MAG: acetyl-CoA carboxylase biotin carboxyl carrier protein [Deltaproteobacteria bacterium]|nr:acetyl-CoA carboxylase biotin carboxyl carrier protein [Deltaproteobacteria bacterium]